MFLLQNSYEKVLEVMKRMDNNVISSRLIYLGKAELFPGWGLPIEAVV